MNPTLYLIRGPENYCSTIEAMMHDKLAAGLAKIEKKNPLYARLGAFPVGLITAVSRPVFAVACFIESIARLIFNGIGSLFSERCRKKLSLSIVGCVYQGLNLIISGPSTVLNTAINVMLCLISPKTYNDYTAFRLKIMKTSDEQMLNSFQALQRRPQTT